MDERYLDEHLGPRLHWTPCRPPERPTLRGRFVSLVPMNADAHAADLWESVSGPGADPDMWLYLGIGPFTDEAEFTAYIHANEKSADPQFLTVIPTDGRAAGQVSYMRMEPAIGVIEIGHIWYGGGIQRTPATTEATYLLAKHVFDDLGYRRLEWKTTALNTRSRNAALRFGFTFEGIFRNAMVIRDRNRDTAWYSMIDIEWPALRDAFETWLDPSNFDEDGNQRRSLSEIRHSP